jgi:hypothetical protein
MAKSTPGRGAGTTKKKKSASKIKQVVDKPREALPAWKSQWPATADLATWFRCGLKKCQAIPDVATSAVEAHLPIEALAELGHVKEALNHVNQHLRRLPTSEVLQTVRMCELGAGICLEANDEAGCDKYLRLAADVDQVVTRKCDKGLGTRSVREFRVRHGLLDPSEAESESERREATFNRAERQFREAVSRGDKRAARNLLLTMHGCTTDVEAWRKAQWLRRIIVRAAELNDSRLTRKLIEGIPSESRQGLLGFSLFARIGMKREAVDAAVREIESKLAELKEMEDPNIHFPIDRISRALQCLIDLGEKRLALHWYGKVVESAKTWKCVILGWTTSAVLTSFVPIAEALEGPDAARELAREAQEHAVAGNRGGFERRALASALAAEADLSPIDEAIAKARKIRSPRSRRMELAKLLAKTCRWKELKEVCRGVESPEEAAKIAWWVKFELPGGEAT